jgi:hypothetical protein
MIIFDPIETLPELFYVLFQIYNFFVFCGFSFNSNKSKESITEPVSLSVWDFKLKQLLLTGAYTLINIRLKNKKQNSVDSILYKCQSNKCS